MGYLNKESSYPYFHGSAISKTDQGKNKQFAEPLKCVFATKVELKDKDLEREIGNFLILNIQNYSHWKLSKIHEIINKCTD